MLLWLSEWELLQIFKSLGLAAVAVQEYLIKRDVKDVKNAVLHSAFDEYES